MTGIYAREDMGVLDLGNVPVLFSKCTAISSAEELSESGQHASDWTER